MTTVIVPQQFVFPKVLDRQFLDGLQAFISPLPLQRYLYLVIGKTSAWTDDNNPPIANLSDSCLRDARSNFYFAKEIPVSQTAFVVPRVQWTSGTVYAQYSYTDPTFQDQDFYVLTSTNRVYKIISNNNGSPSTVEPSSTQMSNFVTPDNYVWKLMFDISQPVINNFLSTNWMPVPTGTQKTSLQKNIEALATQTSTSPIGGHGSSAVNELFAKNLKVYQTLTGTEGGLPQDGSFSYRQAAFVLDPLNINTKALLTSQYYQIVDDSNPVFNKNSGDLLYLTNFSPIIRETGQSEKFSAVIGL